MESRDEYKLKKIIKELKGKHGRHTELISVYVPQNCDINQILSQLRAEQGTASNIKSKTTRKNVVDALERIIQNLRLYKKTPVNGLTLFCGNVSEREGVQDLQLWSIEPPDPINIRIYRCDQEFVTEPLEELVAHKDIYGLITIDNKDATIAVLKGNNYNILKRLASGYHGKHRAGGQSHRRFERVIQDQSRQFKVRVASHAGEIFLPRMENLRGIIVGGPVATKEEFLEGNFLHHELRKKVIAVKDITYTDESGIRELINTSQDVLTDIEMVRQKTLMQEFMKRLVKDGNIAYADDVDKASDMGAIETLLLSENLDEDTLDNLYDKAKQSNSKIEIVSTSFEEGFQLWNTFGGKAALLRFKV